MAAAVAIPAAAYLGSAAIGGLGSLASGFLNHVSQNRVNEANYKMFRESMAYDYRKFKESMYYNSPISQYRQMRAAGYNPAVQTGQPSSISSGSSPSPIPMQPVDFTSSLSAGAEVANAISQGQQTAANVENVQSQTNLNQIEAQTKGLKNLWELNNMVADWKKKGWDTSYLEKMVKGQQLLNEFNEKSMADRLGLTSFQHETAKEQWRALTLSNKYLDKYGDQQNMAAINLQVAQTFAAYATGQSSLKEAHTHLMQMFAQYGKDSKERQAYFRSSLNALIQSRDTGASEEYRNTFFPWSASAGSSVFGSLSHSTMQSYMTNYKSWKKNKWKD